MHSLQKKIRERKGFAEFEGDSMVLKSFVLEEFAKVAQEIPEIRKTPAFLHKVKVWLTNNESLPLMVRVETVLSFYEKEVLGLLVEEEGEK